MPREKFHVKVTHLNASLDQVPRLVKLYLQLSAECHPHPLPVTWSVLLPRKRYWPKRKSVHTIDEILDDSMGSSRGDTEMDKNLFGVQPWCASSIMEKSPSYRISSQKLLLSSRASLILSWINAHQALSLSVRSFTSNACFRSLSRMTRDPVLSYFLCDASLFDISCLISSSTHGGSDFFVWNIFSAVRWSKDPWRLSVRAERPRLKSKSQSGTEKSD